MEIVGLFVLDVGVVIEEVLGDVVCVVLCFVIIYGGYDVVG